MQILLEIVYYLATVLTWIIVIQAVLSWLVAFNIVNTSNEFMRSVLYALDRITAPIYNPIRRIMPDLGALDLSPLVVLLILYIIRNIIIPNLMFSLA
ncbi:YggT family protein [Sphingomonas sp. LaA6.9]|uniref:YggT family protein n=1 Tax=Sphingomonas sp. LaA6.9 TaxID=2919914 RepID=UPI001F4FF7BE|nr:YggT family protein [Sphingomonas sp. LaA6.9]MCJ8159616.1 YggT family protein [Sphingomonas sp. LaA6.9]